MSSPSGQALKRKLQEPTTPPKSVHKCIHDTGVMSRLQTSEGAVFVEFSSQLKGSKWALASGVQLQRHPTPVSPSVASHAANDCRMRNGPRRSSSLLPWHRYAYPTCRTHRPSPHTCSTTARCVSGNAHLLRDVDFRATQLSEVQAEAVLCACQRFTELLTDGR